MKQKVILSAFLSILTASFLYPTTASATEVNRACTNIEIIGARGSGQVLSMGEIKLFIDQLVSKIRSRSSLTISSYQLGTETYGGKRYNAVAINFSTAVDIILKSGSSYNTSVSNGVTEFANYIGQRIKKCPSTKFVAIGYSQGAHVIGDTIPKINPYRNNFSYVALFGDPKLNLPEGRGLIPSACLGKNKSAWNTYVPNCFTHTGRFGARNPYVPSNWAAITNSWCTYGDFVCGSSALAIDNAGHTRYKDAFGIPRATDLAIAKLQSAFPGKIK